MIFQSPFDERFRINRKTSTLLQLQQIRELIQVEDDIWFANPNGLFKLKSTYSLEESQQILKDVIFALHYATDGYVYAGGKTGLFRINPQSLEYVYFENETKDSVLKGGMIWTITEDKDGFLWIGAVDAIQRYNSAINDFLVFEAETNPSLRSTPISGIIP